MSLDDFMSSNKKEYVDFAESLFQILNTQKILILQFENNNLEVLRNNYFYGYVWGFVISATIHQEIKNNFKFESDTKQLINYYCFSKFFELEMSNTSIDPIFDIIISKKYEQCEIGIKDGVKEAKEFLNNNIPSTGLVSKNSGMDREEYISMRKKRKNKERKEEFLDEQNPYSLKRREGFLSEKSLANHLENRLQELAKKKNRNSQKIKNFSSLKEEIINEGSNEKLQWEETLEEKEDVIIYREWRMGDNLNINGNDDCESIVTIKKEDLKDYNFEKLLLVLKNFDEQMCLARFTQFLKDKEIAYDFQAW